MCTLSCCSQVGCLYIDSKTLRNDLQPTTTNTLEMIKSLLVNMSKETCLEVRVCCIAGNYLLKSESVAGQYRSTKGSSVVGW